MNVRKWQQYEICIVINDKSQGNVVKHSSWDELLHAHLSCSFVVKEFLKSANIWQSYRQNG